MEAEIIRVDHALALLVDAAGNDNADALYVLPRNRLLPQQKVDRFFDRLDHTARAVVREADAARLHQLHGLIHKAYFNIGSADIHTDLIHLILPPPFPPRHADQTAS